MKDRNPKRSRAQFLKRLLITVIVTALLLLFFWLQNTILTITQYTYQNAQITQNFDGFRIVQISDLHNASFGSGNSRLLEKIEKLEPDMIVITGDIVDSSHTNIRTAIRFAQEACLLCPVYYINGNHEVWLSSEERDSLYKGLMNAGVMILSDETVELVSGDASIMLTGLQDENLGGGILPKLAAEIESEQFWLLLAHEPQYLDDYSASGADLVLTGHAHGGQFRLPFIGGVVAPDQGFFPEYTEGEHVSGGTTMIISRGLGNSVIPVRLFNQPEIVCIELKAAD